jgi:hypothetical protein
VQRSRCVCVCRVGMAALLEAPALVSSAFARRYFSVCYDVLDPENGLTDSAKQASLQAEWERDSQGLPAMTGLVFCRALFELIGAVPVAEGWKPVFGGDHCENAALWLTGSETLSARMYVCVVVGADQWSESVEVADYLAIAAQIFQEAQAASAKGLFDTDDDPVISEAAPVKAEAPGREGPLSEGPLVLAVVPALSPASGPPQASPLSDALVCAGSAAAAHLCALLPSSTVPHLPTHTPHTRPSAPHFRLPGAIRAPKCRAPVVSCLLPCCSRRAT